MKMFEQIGEFTPDSLITSEDFSILKEGIGLKAGQGVLKRGSLIVKSEKAGYLAGTADIEGKIFGILTDDTDTGGDAAGDNIPAACCQTGSFNRAAVIVAGSATVDTYKDDMKAVSLFLRNVKKYE